jgi:putative heme-binding domain-containing protein
MKERENVQRSTKSSTAGGGSEVCLERWTLNVGRWTFSLFLLFAIPLHAQEPKPNPLNVLVRTLGKIENPEAQANILRGMNASLKGKRDVPAPDGWSALYEKLKTSPSDEVRQQAQALAAVFGGGAALDDFRKTLADATASPDARKAALDSLLAARDSATLPVLLDLAAKPGPLRAAALRGLAAYDDPKIAAALLAAYAGLSVEERRDAITTLATRPASARAMLAAIEGKQLDKGAITAPLARQLQSFKDAEIDAWLTKNWGAVRTSSAEKQQQIANFKKFLGADAIQRADARHGRVLFTQTCAVCHTMFGEGGKIGPELPGSFEDVDYLLQNILDPNAIIGKDYQQTFVTLKDGRLVAGVVAAEDPGSITLKTLAEPVTVQRSDIASATLSEMSMMPEGLLTALDEQGVRDLFAYLRQKQQVPLP